MEPNEIAAIVDPATRSQSPGNASEHSETLEDAHSPNLTERPTVGGEIPPSASQRTLFSHILRRTATAILLLENPVSLSPSLGRQIYVIFGSSWLNVLLIFVPVSWIMHFIQPKQYTLIFAFSYLAIVPLTKLLAFTTDELAIRLGSTLARLLHATLGNTVPFIIAVIALVQCKLRIVQSSLIGSILGNMLLGLGMCFLAGGTRFSEQGFGSIVLQINVPLLTISVVALLLPAALHLTAYPAQKEVMEGAEILKVSRGVSIVLLFMYGSYLLFRLFSHQTLYQGEDIKTISKPPTYTSHLSPKRLNPQSFERPSKMAFADDSLSDFALDLDIEVQVIEALEEASEEEEPLLSVMMAVGLLIILTTLIIVTSAWLVDSIDGLTESNHINAEFVGIIILPIISNIANNITAVIVCVKDKLVLSTRTALDSSIQIAICIIPLMITLSWALGNPLTLLFDPLESIILLLTVLTLGHVNQGGRSNWFEGAILICFYVALCVIFWFHLGFDPSRMLATCH